MCYHLFRQQFYPNGQFTQFLESVALESDGIKNLKQVFLKQSSPISSLIFKIQVAALIAKKNEKRFQILSKKLVGL